jgi:predicted glycogen debranching enzyme
MLNHVEGAVRTASGERVRLDPDSAVHDAPGATAVATLAEFRLERGLPVWRFEHGGWTLERRVVMPHGQNTVHVTYRLVAGDRLHLELRPYLHVRHFEDAVCGDVSTPRPALDVSGSRLELQSDRFPPLRLWLQASSAALIVGTAAVAQHYPEEEARGYECVGEVWSPGGFEVDIRPASAGATLIVSTEEWAAIEGLSPDAARDREERRRASLLERAGYTSRFAQELVLAADQFIIVPAGRPGEPPAATDDAGPRTVIAGYHWFTDWGRDTMIALEGLTLATGRTREAASILRTFAGYVRDGLIPNMFPDVERQGLYHTADATLWFFHAVHRYLALTGDRGLLQALLPTLRGIVEHHMRGTRFGIGVDPDDGLLKQGAAGLALTWMDASVEGWVVTPRRGKAVEINALFYNALRLLEGWERGERRDDAARRLGEAADRVEAAFNRRFWYEQGGYLYDVIDGERGDDAACRPNQILALSLPHPVLHPVRWRAVLEVVRARLLTPRGLRSLAPDHPDYCTRYCGDLRTRDAAYHQGTVWGWLVGPFVDAWLRVAPEDRDRARDLVGGFDEHLGEAGVGTISEIFDGDPPFRPRGCIAQAWSVAEVLRAWRLTHRA